MKRTLAILMISIALVAALAGTAAPLSAQEDCMTWTCELQHNGVWRCHWSLPPTCPALATPLPLSTYVATRAVQGQYPNALPPPDPLVQPCAQDGYAYDTENSCLSCASSPYPNVAGTTVCQACQSVTRQPYPRGMVGLENRFRLYGPATAETVVQVCTTKNDCAANIHVGGVRDVKYYLRWVRADDQIPTWGWDERPWNVANHSAPDTGFGWQASHVYWTSSFNLVEGCIAGCDKPANGPSLVAGEHLPAYQVRVLVPWYAQYRVTYQALRHWSRCGWSLHTGDCCNGGDLPSNCTPVVHDPPMGGDHGCTLNWLDCISANRASNYEDGVCWENKDTGWQPIDGRLIGSGYSYVYGDRAGNEATDLEPARCDVIPVPVIEVQGVLDQH